MHGVIAGVQHKPKVSAAQKAAAATAVISHQWVKASSENLCGLCLDKGTKGGFIGRLRGMGVSKARIT